MKKMKSIDKINLILKLDNEGKTRQDIRDIIGYSSVDSLTKFMKNHGYTYNNGYMLKDSDKSMTIVSDDNSMKKVSEDNNTDEKGMTSLINSELKNNLVGLAGDYPDIKKMLEWFKTMNDDKGMIEVSAVVTDGLKIDIDQSEYIRTTVRIGKDSWNKFEKFCNENREFKKQDLLSQAVEEFIEKYK
ncbi:MAG: hypothetical protein J6D47_13330 [Peptostreptococcaceae bacterium]|nr:hypothetical protein [Peptostreptococcaceae bacterium]MBP3930533.1 hypothetical protein [Peptostreptococcaceae bacterium]